jgi:MSHA biogenesis protein MshO
VIRRSRGFTLIEIVATITVSAIVISFAAMFIVTPVNAYRAQARRAELVDSADSVLRLMARDIRAALPNSVRVTQNGSVWVLGVLSTVDGVRYRSTGATAVGAEELNFGSPDDSFNAVSQFDGITRPFVTNSHYLVIYNVGVPGADAYSSANVITPPATQITIDTSPTRAFEDRIQLVPSFRFAYASPSKRVFLVSGPVSYLCNQTTGVIQRYVGGSIAPTIASSDSAGELSGLGAVPSLVANNATTCNFEYSPGAPQRAGLVTLRITLARDGETVSLVHQVHVENGP